MKRHTLSYEQTPLRVMALKSPMPLYRIAWLLNLHLKFELRRCEDLEIEKAVKGSAKGLFSKEVRPTKVSYAQFKQHVEPEGGRILLSNEMGGHWLFEEARGFDALLFSEILGERAEETYVSVKSIPDLTADAIVELDVSTLEVDPFETCYT